MAKAKRTSKVGWANLDSRGELSMFTENKIRAEDLQKQFGGRVVRARGTVTQIVKRKRT